MPMRIGHLSTFYHTSLLLMARGRVEAVCKEPVSWRLFGTGPAIVDAFSRGELDLAYIGLPPAIIGIERGVQIRCIAGGHMEGTVIIGREEHRGYPESGNLGEILSQFRGLTIGVPGRGSIHDVILNEYLEKYGLRESVGVRNFAWSDQVTEAVVKGQVSAAVGTPALAVALQRYAEGRILYPPSKTWPYNPSYGIVADAGFLEREGELTEKFLLLHEEAASFIRNYPREASRVISGYVGFIDEQFVFDTIRVSPKYCSQLTDAYISSSMEFVPVLKRLGYIQRDVSREEIFDVSMIQKVHPGRDHYGDGVRE